MPITRSKSKAAPPLVPPPVSGQTSMQIFDAAVDYIPSWMKEPPRDEIRKRSFPLMPLYDPETLPKKGIYQALVDRHYEILEKDNRPKPKKRTIVREFSKTTPGMYLRHTAETRIWFLERLGLFFYSRQFPFTKDIKSKEYAWSGKLIQVLKIAIKISKIQHRDVISMLSLSKTMHDNLISRRSLWRTLDFHGMNNAGDRLVEALSMPRYHFVVKYVNLEFAKDIEDEHFKLIKKKFLTEEEPLQYIATLNLNGCQNITNTGVKDITAVCPDLQTFSICGNLRVTDYGIKLLVRNCLGLTHLNFTDCKNITDESLVELSESPDLESLDITRCVKVTDAGVIAVAVGCPCLKSLSLFGISGVTNKCLEVLSQNCSNTLTTLDVGCSGIKRQQKRIE